METNDTKAERDARLAAALRANLRRRKTPVPPGEPSAAADDARDADDGQRPIA